MRHPRFCPCCLGEIPKKRRCCPKCGIRVTRRERLTTAEERGFGALRARLHRSPGQRAKLGQLD